VGLCSYLLIGFWYDKVENAAAGKKAFLVNRIGDAGFLLGLFLLVTTLGTHGVWTVDVTAIEQHLALLAGARTVFGWPVPTTVSQLGFMFLGLGVGAPGAAVFHLVTHAFFKALLFLGAGSVIHGLGGEQDLERMGGLRRYMPITFWTMTIGAVAIAGVPPASGFFSKDEILHAAIAGPHALPALGVVGFVAASLTAFYIGRLLFLTFLGECRAP